MIIRKSVYVMRHNFYFDLSILVPHQNSMTKKVMEALEERQKKNPREGRYFVKPEKDPTKDIPKEDLIETEYEGFKDLSDAVADRQEENKYKPVDTSSMPIGEEIPEYVPDTPKEEDASDNTETIIDESAPQENDPEYTEEAGEPSTESTTEEENFDDELNDIDSILEEYFYPDYNDIEDEEPAQESVGRETPEIPSVLREVEAEDKENPIPLNISATTKRKSADPKIDPETYVDKKEDSNEAKVKKMIYNFTSLPLTKKKAYANEIYNFIMDNHVDVNLCQYRSIWKLVDNPFIESQEKE